MFGQTKHMSDQGRHRVLWGLWALSFAAMAVGIWLLSGLFVKLEQNARDRADWYDYQSWVQDQLDLKYFALRNLVETAQLRPEDAELRDALKGHVATLINGTNDLLATSTEILTQDDIALFERSLSAQERFIAEFTLWPGSGGVVTDQALADLKAILSELMVSRREIVPTMVTRDIAEDQRSFESLRMTLTQVYRASSVGVLGLLGLLALNVMLMLGLRRNAQVMHRSTENLRTIVQASRDGVFLTDRDFNIVAMGKSAEAIFGCPEADVLETSITNLFMNDRSEFAELETALDADAVGNAEPIRLELHGKRTDGSTFPADVGVTVVADSDGEQAYVISVADNSEQAERELSLMQARNEALQAERAKSRFLASMSHEMRTPLNGVLASLDLMRETTGLDERQTELLSIIERCGDEALEQVENVLELTRLDNIAKTAVNVSAFAPVAMLREIVEVNEHKAENNRNALTLETTVPDNLNVIGSGILFRQIMHNFVSNAIKFTAGGDISVQVSAEDLGNGELLFRASVVDTGIGIENEDLERIFNNFETIRDSYTHFRSGSGLGLSIAKHSADLLNGEIEVESVPGEGSRFTLVVTWPKVASDNDANIDLLTQARPESEGGMDILVVEDNEINRQMLVDMLQAKGHRVTQAVDGLEGVSAGREKQFDLILMDISMPKLDGVGATRMLRQFGKSRSSPIVAVTAHSQPEHMKEFLEAGMDRVLTKPLRMATLDQLFEDMGQAANAVTPPSVPPVAIAMPAEGRGTEVDTDLDTGFDTSNVVPIDPSAPFEVDLSGPTAEPETEPEPTPTPPTEPPEEEVTEQMADDLIEQDVFDGLVDMLGGEAVVGYVEQFANDAQTMLPVFEKAIADGDFKTARAEAHRCAGGAAVIGAAKVHEMLQDMTHSADAGESGKCLEISANLLDATRNTVVLMTRAVS